MKNLKVGKKMLAVAMFNTILLTSLPNNIQAQELTGLETATSEDTILGNVFLNADASIYSNPNFNGVLGNVSKLSCFELKQETKDAYIVSYGSVLGYIKKNEATKLDGTYIIVDISDQEVKMYHQNKLVVDSPVVTGGRGHSTSTGFYAIGNKDNDVTHDRYLVGPTWKSWVSYMMKFDGNKGFHDAEYHTDANGRKHGWRNTSEFGGETYLTNGSHGCVNMPYDAAKAMYTVVAPIVNEQGEKVKVLIKD